MNPEIKDEEEEDSIIAEVRRTKIKLLERYNYDLEAMFRDVQARQYLSGHEVVDFSGDPPRRNLQLGA